MPDPRPPKPPRIPIRRRALVVGVLALAGCAVAPLPPLQRDTPASWQHADRDAAPAPDLRGWWKAFGDAGLDRLVDAALAENLGIAQAGLRIEAARMLDAHANDAALPEFAFRTYAEPTPDSSASYFQAGFDAKWEFGLFGRAQSRARVSAGDLGIAESEQQAARVSVVAEVVRAYVELRAAERRLALLGRIAACAQQKRELVATRERLRLASTRDAARARADEATAQAALAEPRAEIVRARRQLAALLGRSDENVVDDGAPLVLGETAANAAALPADLLRTRPEIRRAQAEVVKAAGELGLAEADLYPRIGLGGALTYAARVIGHTRLSDADGIVTFGPAIDIPLFDWGARRAARDARAKLLQSSALAYRQAVLDGVAEAEAAMAALHERTLAARALRDGVAALGDDARSARALQRFGLADGIDVAASDSASLQAELDLLQAEQQRSLAFVALYKALGGAPLPSATGSTG
ncbi:TolC family protein [Dokdonella sp.]|uniref:TolC family protein n=1 Tax=Dokdonella sp. TaxID=2291710 RepID=UPI002F3E5985